MKISKHSLAVALSVATALVLPGTALARHGADDATPQAGDDTLHVETHSTEAGVDNQQPATPETEPEHAQQAPAHVRVETYILRGTVVSADAAGDTVVVEIKKANHGRRGRALIGQDVTVDLSATKVDAADVSEGDRVEVRVRLPRSQPDMTQPVAAQRFRDRDSR